MIEAPALLKFINYARRRISMHCMKDLFRAVMLISTGALSGCSLFLPDLKPMPATRAGVTFRDEVEKIARAESEKRGDINKAIFGSCLANRYAQVAKTAAAAARESARKAAGGGQNPQDERERPAEQNPIEEPATDTSRLEKPSSDELRRRRQLDAARADERRQRYPENRASSSKSSLQSRQDEERETNRARPAPIASPSNQNEETVSTSDDEIFAACSDALKDIPPMTNGEPTLRHIRAAYGNIYKSIDAPLMRKHTQQYVYKEAAAASGGLAVIGGMADKLGAQNTGLLGLLAFLGLEQLYAPTETKKVHLKAEKMFSCISSEIGRVSDADRENAMKSSEPGAAIAADAVDIVIGMVDEALVAYRGAILTQEPGTLSKADFERFVKDYAGALKSEADAKAKAAILGGTPEQRVNDHAAAKFLALPTNIEVCLKNFSS